MFDNEERIDMEQTEIVSDVIEEMGTIAAHTKIAGNITTKGHLAVMGTVIGDISAKGNVLVSLPPFGVDGHTQGLVEGQGLIKIVGCDGDVGVAQAFDDVIGHK